VALRWRPSTSWLTFLAASFVGAFVASIVFAATAGGGLGRLISTLPAITPLGWVLVAYVMVFPSILSQLFYARGLELIGANRASLFINLIPLFGALGSVIVLGETLQPFHLIAGALIIVGIALAEWSARQR
jgi:drug/metabolite transporter (DMT)-like permease